MDSGQHSIIENNDFIDNVEPDQVCDDGDTNTYASNYWHTWIGDDSNSDNIIDTPYTINGTANSVDDSPAAFPNTQLPNWYDCNPITHRCPNPRQLGPGVMFGSCFIEAAFSKSRNTCENVLWLLHEHLTSPTN